VVEENGEDTRELLHCGGYTIVGLAWFPYYLNYERGTSSLGSGSVAAAVYIPEDGFDFEVYHELYLSMADMGEPYSDAYSWRMAWRIFWRNGRRYGTIPSTAKPWRRFPTRR
jgi:putative ABC transport system permease protein